MNDERKFKKEKEETEPNQGRSFLKKGTKTNEVSAYSETVHFWTREKIKSAYQRIIALC